MCREYHAMIDFIQEVALTLGATGSPFELLTNSEQLRVAAGGSDLSGRAAFFVGWVGGGMSLVNA